MNKKLFNQIKNEWNSNLWLIAELLLVSVVMWFIVDNIYTNTSIYLQPRGFDISHCYEISMGTFSSSDPDYIPTDTAVQRKNVEELMNRLKRRPDIEAACLSHGSYPYNGSQSWGPLKYGKMNQNIVCIRIATPDFLRVFRYQGANGETPEKLAKILSNSKNGFMASNDVLIKEHGIKLTSLVGKGFYLWDDSIKTHPLLAAYQPVRYHDYQETYRSYSILVGLHPDEYDTDCELCVRVKARDDRGFKDRLWKDADKQLRIGNIYVSNITPFTDIHRNYEQRDTNRIRNYLFGACFLMFNIFLGLLGTFWFRIQQRRSEIALFKVLGATNNSVFVREITEGLLLLTIATIPAVIIDWNLAFAQLNTDMDGTNLAAGRFIITILITWLLIALMIILGIWIPAKKAMKIEPALALHEE